MKWFRADGEGHVAVAKNEGALVGACGVTATIDQFLETEEPAVITERPFGADSCKTCHFTVKGWTANPKSVPDGVTLPGRGAMVSRAMTKEKRDAAVHGDTQPVPMRREPPLAPLPPEEFPGDIGSGSSVGGAMFVPPAGQEGRIDRRPSELDSDGPL